MVSANIDASAGKPQFSHRVNIASGIIASTITDVVFIPMELLKIRMQQCKTRMSGWQMARDIYKKEGWFGFYRGSLFGFIFLGVVSTARLYTYRYLHYFSERYELMSHYPVRILASSFIVGLITSISMNPLEHIRIKAVSPEFSVALTGSIKAAQYIVKNYGFIALQKAYPYAFAREFIFHIVFFHTYESTKDYFNRLNKPGLGLTMASLVASPLAWFTVYPIDTIKTNLQGDSLKNPKWTATRYLNHLRSENDLRSLYRGLPSIVFRSAVVNLIFLVSWEKSLVWLQKIEDSHSI